MDSPSQGSPQQVFDWKLAPLLAAIEKLPTDRRWKKLMVAIAKLSDRESTQPLQDGQIMLKPKIEDIAKIAKLAPRTIKRYVAAIVDSDSAAPFLTIDKSDHQAHTYRLNLLAIFAGETDSRGVTGVTKRGDRGDRGDTEFGTPTPILKNHDYENHEHDAFEKTGKRHIDPKEFETAAGRGRLCCEAIAAGRVEDTPADRDKHRLLIARALRLGNKNAVGLYLAMLTGANPKLPPWREQLAGEDERYADEHFADQRATLGSVSRVVGSLSQRGES